MRRLILLLLTALTATLLTNHHAPLHGVAYGLSVSSGLVLSSATFVAGGGLLAHIQTQQNEFHVPSVRHGGALLGESSDTFKLSVLGPSKGVDPSCTYSLVEFQNNHPTEYIIVYSAHIEPSVVFPLHTADQIAPNSINASTPPLFPDVDHVFADRELHIHPGSTVMVPVSIFPHWKRYYGSLGGTKTRSTVHRIPHGEAGHDPPESSPSSNASTHPTPIRSSPNDVFTLMESFSSISNNNNHFDSLRADVSQMIQTAASKYMTTASESFHDFIRQGRIHETLIANTSWGFLRMKVPSCIPNSKEYEYGLPNNLMFMDGGGGWYARTNATPTGDAEFLFGEIPGSTDREDSFVYDIFMDNPSKDMGINVWDVFTTMPEMVTLEVRTSSLDPAVHYPLVGVHIPPRGNGIYVASVRLLPILNSSMISSLTDLGFLEIRTSDGAFSIALDFIPNRGKWGIVHGIGTNYSTIGNIDATISRKLKELFESISSNEEIKVATHEKTSIVRVYQKSDSDQSQATNQFMNTQRQQVRFLTLDSKEKYDGDDAALLAHPSTLHFGVITSSTSAIQMPVSLANTFLAPIRLMQISVTMKMTAEHGFPIPDDDKHKLLIGVDFAGAQQKQSENEELLEFPHDIIFPPMISLKNPISCWCRLVPSRGSVFTPRSYTGTIILRYSRRLHSTYDEWREQTLLDDPWSREFTTVIPFEVSVIPGNFRISTESLLFPAYFSMLSPKDLQSARTHRKSQKRDYFDRDLELMNNFVVPINITNMSIANSRDYSACKEIFSIPKVDSDCNPDWRRAESTDSWRLPVRFTFSDAVKSIRSPKRCILTLETDRVGRQSLPLIIHSGQLIVEVEDVEGGRKVSECLTNKDGILNQETGTACLQYWLNNQAEGIVFNDAIENEDVFNRSGACGTNYPRISTAYDYFMSLLSQNRGINEMDPVVINVGAVNNGTVVSRSIFLTNMNPANVDVTVSSASFEDMNVSIAYTSSSILTAMEELPYNGDIKYFLTNSALSQDFFSKSNLKVDISLSPRVGAGELRSMYAGQAVVQTFQNLSYFEHEGTFHSNKENMKCSASLVLSTDQSFVKTQKSRRVGTKTWKIPPGGVARFTVTLKTPNSSNLNSDVTSFVATGLALETNHGQALPIILSYSIFVGQLNLLPTAINGNDDQGHRSKDHTFLLKIPASIRDDAHLDFDRGMGIPLSIESTFSKDIFLGEIKSCNQWFKVAHRRIHPAHTRSNLSEGLNNLIDIDPFSNFLLIKGANKSLSDSSTIVPVGEAHSVVKCSSSSKSFFDCALNWLQDRDKIQPHGCGLSEKETLLNPFMEVNFDSKVRVLKAQAINSLKHATLHLLSLEGRARTNPYVSSSSISTIKDARSAWDSISSFGLNILTGHLTAFTGYYNRELLENNRLRNNEDAENIEANKDLEVINNRGNLLSVPVSSLLLQSTLEIPRLFKGETKNSSGLLEFGRVYVASSSSLFIHVSNPTDLSIRVHLSAEDGGTDDNDSVQPGNLVFVQSSASEHNAWWTARSFWMPAKDGRLLSAAQNVTFTSGSGSFVSLVDPSLQTISAFVLGCGTRCGRRSDADNMEEDVYYSTIGSGSGSQSTLLGHPWHDITKQQSPGVRFSLRNPQPFSLGHLGAKEVVLPPYGKAKLGPVFFRPPNRGEFSSSIYISNNLTGLEEVRVCGRGAREELVFLDSHYDLNGGDIEFRNGRSTLVFSGSSSMDGKPVFKSFVLANLGDVSVNISNVYMASSEIRHFSHRRPHPSFSFWQEGILDIFFPMNYDQGSTKCSILRFSLLDCVEIIPKRYDLWSRLLIPWYSAIKRVVQQSLYPSVKAPTKRTKSPANFFTLGPGENRSFFIEHRPDCVLRASYASVIFEISGRDIPSPRGTDAWYKSFRKDKLELLVGYSMNSFDYCMPYIPPASKMLEKSFTFAIPHFIVNILRFRFSRRDDSRKNDSASQHRFEVSYIAALFILLLTMLAIDLLLSVEFPTSNGYQGLSWKQTCRCLARADPSSTDLVALGKEQSVHVLLGRFRRANVLPTHCVLPDGRFTRAKPGSEGLANPSSRRMSSSNQNRKTLSDSVFYRLNSLSHEANEANLAVRNNSTGLLPCGLAWRMVSKWGMQESQPGVPSSFPETTYLARTSIVLSSKESSRQLQEICQPLLHPTMPPEKCHTDVNSNFNVMNGHPLSQTNGDGKDVPQQDHTFNSSGQNEQSNVPEDSDVTYRASKHIALIDNKLSDQNGLVGTASVAPNCNKLSTRVERTNKCADATRLTQTQPTEEEKTKNEQERRTEAATNHDRSIGNDLSTKPKKRVHDTKLVPEHDTLSRGTSDRTQASIDSVNEIVSRRSKNKQSVGKEPRQVEHVSLEIRKREKSQHVKDKNQLREKTIQGVARGKDPRKVHSIRQIARRSTSKDSETNSSSASSGQKSPCSETTSVALNRNPGDEEGIIRPPPGLLPPPGFQLQHESIVCSSPERRSGNLSSPRVSPLTSLTENSPSGTTNLPSELQSSQSIMFELQNDYILSTPLYGLISPQLDDEYGLQNSDDSFIDSILISDLAPPSLTEPISEQKIPGSIDGNESTDVTALLGAGSNFNVMSFLDGIMNESSQPHPIDEALTASTGVAASNPVSLDPWNTEVKASPQRNPLATIIERISDVEATTFRSRDDHNEIAGIPLNLLSPSTLQRNIAMIEPTYASFATEVYEDKNDGFLEPDSFYSQLLGEE